jgi:Uri superfamily endonuclease
MARHLRKRKRLRWHVDYLLQYGIIERGIVYPPGLFTECELNRFTLEVLKGRIPIPGFGASDRHCSSHLICCPPAQKASGIQKIICAERGLRAKPLEWEKAAEMMHMEPID